MTDLNLLFVYSLVIIVVSLLGGWLPSRFKFGHTQVQIMMSFVAGLMLGIACYHLLPHAVVMLSAEEAAVDDAMWWLMVGLLFMFVLLRAFHFHQHGHQQEECQHDHGGAGHAVSGLSWMGIALGLGLHTIIDGVALAAAVGAAGAENSLLGLAGLGVFIAIVLHKPLDAMSISSLMLVAGARLSTRLWVTALFSLLCPLGAVLFWLGLEWLPVTDANALVGVVLAFSAGVFICISLSDLLPEVQFHSHDRLTLTVALFFGIAVAYGIGQLEPEGAHGGHGHHDEEHINLLSMAGDDR
ncbi:MAG: zinc and cadmium transporter [Oceanicoccus sp.]|jgi:zinc and cadmium transporter